MSLQKINTFIAKFSIPPQASRRADAGIAVALILGSIILFSALIYIISQSLQSSGAAINRSKNRSADIGIIETAKQQILSNVTRTNVDTGTDIYSISQVPPAALVSAANYTGNVGATTVNSTRCSFVRTSPVTTRAALTQNTANVIRSANGFPICAVPVFYSGSTYDFDGVDSDYDDDMVLVAPNITALDPSTGDRAVDGNGDLFYENSGGRYAAFALLLPQQDGSYVVDANGTIIGALRDDPVDEINSDINAGDVSFGFTQIIQSYKDMAVTSGATKLELVTVSGACTDLEKQQWDGTSFSCQEEFSAGILRTMTSPLPASGGGFGVAIPFGFSLSDGQIFMNSTASTVDGIKSPVFRWKLDPFLEGIKLMGNCNDTSRKLLWNSATRKFRCVNDPSGGGGAITSITSVGGGTTLIEDGLPPIPTIRTIAGAGGISISESGGLITIDGAAAGGGFSGQNLGSGANVYVDSTDGDFRTLVGRAGIAVQQEGSEIVVSVDPSAALGSFTVGDNSIADVGAGVGSLDPTFVDVPNNTTNSFFSFRIDTNGSATPDDDFVRMDYNLNNIVEATGHYLQKFSFGDPVAQGIGWIAGSCIEDVGGNPMKLQWSRDANGGIGGFICQFDDRGYKTISLSSDAVSTPVGAFLSLNPLEITGDATTDGEIKVQQLRFADSDFNVVGTSGGYEIRTQIAGQSDVRLKDDIKIYKDSAAAFLRQLDIKSFAWNADKATEILDVPAEQLDEEFRTDRTQVGLIAQEVKALLPDFVKEKQNVFVIKYDKFIPYLIKAVQEVADLIDGIVKRLMVVETLAAENSARISELKNTITQQKQVIDTQSKLLENLSKRLEGLEKNKEN